MTIPTTPDLRYHLTLTADELWAIRGAMIAATVRYRTEANKYDDWVPEIAEQRRTEANQWEQLQRDLGSRAEVVS